MSASLQRRILLTAGRNTHFLRFADSIPERDAEHYQEKPRPKGTHLMEVHNLGFSYKKGPDVFKMSVLKPMREM